jgi:hypothetical protein
METRGWWYKKNKWPCIFIYTRPIVFIKYILIKKKFIMVLYTIDKKIYMYMYKRIGHVARICVGRCARIVPHAT